MKLFIQIYFSFYFIVISSHANEDYISKNELEKIIEEYLLENPEVLIESLENYRNKQEAQFEENKRKFITSFYKNKKHETLPYAGKSDGPIIITEFIDYNCGYCKKTLLSINELLKKYKNLKVVFIDFPILSESSYSAAQAAIAAYKQNAYFKYHSALLNSNKKISNSYLLELAKNFNLDLVKFEKDMKSKNTANLIENNIKFARQLNIRGTPTFIINKEIYAGAYDTKKLEEILNKI